MSAGARRESAFFLSVADPSVEGSEVHVEDAGDLLFIRCAGQMGVDGQGTYFWSRDFHDRLPRAEDAHIRGLLQGLNEDLFSREGQGAMEEEKRLGEEENTKRQTDTECISLPFFCGFI